MSIELLHFFIEIGVFLCHVFLFRIISVHAGGALTNHRSCVFVCVCAEGVVLTGSCASEKGAAFRARVCD